MMSIIRLNSINKYYVKGSEYRVHALKDVSIDIAEGEMLAVTGVSGSGKSTLLNILGCIDTFDSGIYMLDGTDVSKCSDRRLAEIRNKHIGFILQKYGLIYGKTVYDNIALPLLLSKNALRSENIENRIDSLLDMLGISDKKHNLAEALSGGQQQRVAIGRAMANHPKILIADEPTGSLDRSTSDEIMNIFTALNKSENMTLIVSTHDPYIYERFPRVIVLEDGKIIKNSV